MTNDDRSLDLGPSGGQAQPSPQSAGGPTLAYVVIGLASLAVGVAGTWLVLRSRSAAAPAVSAVAPPAGQTSGHEGMPGMGGGAEGDRPVGASEKAVYIPPERQQLIGVRTAKVGQRDLETTIRTVGTLAVLKKVL